jgi:uncharacterized Zn finger protein
MVKSLYIICAKCGSDEIRFNLDKPVKPEGEDWDRGVSIRCQDCGELTSPEEYNDWMNR